MTLIVGLLAAPLATFVTYMVNRKKNLADSHAAIALGASNAVEAITIVLDSLREELENTKNELNLALHEIEKLRIQNEKLLSENKELYKKIQYLTHKIEEMNSEK